MRLMHQPTRREALKQIGAAGAGMLAAPALLAYQETGIVVAGQPVDIAVSAVNPDCVRITIRQITGGSDGSLADGALAKDAWPKTGPAPIGKIVDSGSVRVIVSDATGQPPAISLQVTRLPQARSQAEFVGQ